MSTTTKSATLTNNAASRRRFVRTAIIMLVLAIGVPVSLSQLGSTSDARFGAADELGPNQLSAATLSVAPGSQAVNLVVNNMAPGDRARGRIDLQNNGSLPLRYSLQLSLDGTSAAGMKAAEQMQLRVWHALTCGATPPSDSSILFRSRPMAPGRVLFGDPAIGPDPGDREIPVGGTDTLCYSIRLPIGAPNYVQGQTVNQAFVALAEHDLTAEASN